MDRAGHLGECVDRNHPDQIRFLAELVRVPSDNPPGDCAAHAEVTAKLIEGLGFEVERHSVPADLVAARGMLSVTNLVVRQCYGPGPVIALNAHGDVVPPGAGWVRDPYGAEVYDGNMFGRGVAVSKSDIATYVFALKALEAVGASLNGTVELHLTYDEESGGLLGPAWLLAQKLTTPDFVISAGFSYSVIVAHNGCLHLEVQVEGRSAHAAQPDAGADALQAATKILASLYELRESYCATRSATSGIHHPTLVIGLIAGGINTNVVPDKVSFRIDRRIIPEETPADVERALIEHIETVGALLKGVRVSTRRILLASPLVPALAQNALASLLQRHAQQEFCEVIPAVGSPLYTDARIYATAGIPTVLYGAGPKSLLEANAHRADEQLVLEDLRKATRVIALTLADLLSGAATQEQLDE